MLCSFPGSQGWNRAGAQEMTVQSIKKMWERQGGGDSILGEDVVSRTGKL